MRGKSYYLGLLFLLFTAASCPRCPEICNDFYVEAEYGGSEIWIDSLVNQTDGIVLNEQINRFSSGFRANIQVNPEREQSMFLIYANLSIDTLLLKHQYIEYYDNECDIYLFKLLEAEIAYSTLDSSYVEVSGSGCASIGMSITR